MVTSNSGIKCKDKNYKIWQDYWYDNEGQNKGRLTGIFRHLKAAGVLNIGKLAKTPSLAGTLYTPATLESALRKLLNQNANSDPGTLKFLMEGLLICLEDDQHSMSAFDLRADPEVWADFERLTKSFKESCETLEGHVERPANGVHSKKYTDVFSKVIPLLCHGRGSPRKTAKFLFGTSKPKKEVSYLTLRKSRYEGQIARSMTTVYPPIKDNEGDADVITFRNWIWLPRRNRPSLIRKSSGFVVSMNNWIYFIGSINEGDGLKVIALHGIENKGDLYGLVFTHVPHGPLITSNIVMLRLPSDEVISESAQMEGLQEHYTAINEDRAREELEEMLIDYMVPDLTTARVFKAMENTFSDSGIMEFKPDE